MGFSNFICKLSWSLHKIMSQFISWLLNLRFAPRTKEMFIKQFLLCLRPHLSNSEYSCLYISLLLACWTPRCLSSNCHLCCTHTSLLPPDVPFSFLTLYALNRHAFFLPLRSENGHVTRSIFLSLLSDFLNLCSNDPSFEGKLRRLILTIWTRWPGDTLRYFTK